MKILHTYYCNHRLNWCKCLSYTSFICEIELISISIKVFTVIFLATYVLKFLQFVHFQDFISSGTTTFRVYITLHSYGEVIIFPFADNDALCRGYIRLLEGATVMSRVMRQSYDSNVPLVLKI